MVSASIVQNSNFEYPINEYSFMGLSTDTKPTETYDGLSIKNGSTFYAMDTKKVYMYDANGKTWLEQ